MLLDDAIMPTPDVNVGDGFTTSVLSACSTTTSATSSCWRRPSLVRDDNGLAREVTGSPSRKELSIATFNVENLDPNPPMMTGPMTSRASAR